MGESGRSTNDHQPNKKTSQYNLPTNHCLSEVGFQIQINVYLLAFWEINVVIVLLMFLNQQGIGKQWYLYIWSWTFPVFHPWRIDLSKLTTWTLCFGLPIVQCVTILVWQKKSQVISCHLQMPSVYHLRNGFNMKIIFFFCLFYLNPQLKSFVFKIFIRAAIIFL